MAKAQNAETAKRRSARHLKTPAQFHTFPSGNQSRRFHLDSEKERTAEPRRPPEIQRRRQATSAACHRTGDEGGELASNRAS